MPTTCEFQLDRLNTIYTTGEYINGRIILRTKKVKRVNAVFVTLEGEAKVQWSMSGKGESTNYFGHQQYLHVRTNVFDSTDFPAGTHVYNLTLRIPPDCPSTCQGPYGYISYNISLTLDKPWSFDEVFRKPVIVYQALDLNYNPEYKLPVKDENIKFLCHWPCRSGPILSTLIIPFGGYVPDQHIPFLLEIDNQSPHYDIAGIEASLKQHFVFLARKPLKRNYYTKTLAKTVINERTLRLSKRMYESTVVVPPDTQRSTLNNNYIVFLHYTLNVKLKTGRLHYDTDISVPVVIGTVPLRQRRNGDTTLVTMQPTTTTARTARLERRNHRSRNGSSDISIDDLDILEEDADNDEPPSYDSCLPPSFSFATSGSLQTVDSSLQANSSNERRRININLPQFPGYNTFVSTAQAENYASHPDLDYIFDENSRENLLRSEWRSLDDFVTVHRPMSTDNDVSDENILEETNNL